LANGEPVWLEEGTEFCFVNDRSVIGDHTKVATNYEKEVVQVGDIIFVDDGLLSFSVLSRTDNGIRCTVDNSGYLGECKVIMIIDL
jgi:pyruvate kinase